MRSEIWKQYANCDVILLAHDNAFGILSGTTYLYYIYLPFLAKIIKKPIMFYGGSILKKPKNFPFWGTALKFSFKYTDLITLRERVTYNRLKEDHLLNNKIIVTGDPAFLNPPASPKEVDKILQTEGLHSNPQPMVGMTISRRATYQSFTGLDKEACYRKHIGIIAESMDYMINKYRIKVVFIPHCIGVGSEYDDRIAAQDIYQICKNKSAIKIITNEYSASELKGLIGRCKLFIGERLHSTINALSMYVPSIVMVKENDQRQDIIKMLGQEAAILYINNMNSKVLTDKIDNVWTRAELIKTELEKQVPLIKEKSMQNVILLQKLLTSPL